MELQAAAELEPTGVVDPATWVALEQEAITAGRAEGSPGQAAERKAREEQKAAEKAAEEKAAAEQAAQEALETERAQREVELLQDGDRALR